MRVNNIDYGNLHNTSFGKVIRVNTESAPYSKDGFEMDLQTKSIINAIEGKKTSAIDKKALNIIGKFLRAKIGDYTPKTGIVTENVDGDTYIFTGKDAIVAEKVINKAGKGEASMKYSRIWMEKELELSEIIGKARYTNSYNEIDADFDDNGRLTMVRYIDNPDDNIFDA